MGDTCTIAAIAVKPVSQVVLIQFIVGPMQLHLWHHVSLDLGHWIQTWRLCHVQSFFSSSIAVHKAANSRLVTRDTFRLVAHFTHLYNLYTFFFLNGRIFSALETVIRSCKVGEVGCYCRSRPPTQWCSLLGHRHGMRFNKAVRVCMEFST